MKIPTLLATLILTAAAACAQSLAAPFPFPEIAPADVSNDMDRRQMMWQLGIEWPTLPDMQTDYETVLEPALTSRGSDVRLALRQEGVWTWSAGESSTGSDYTGNTYIRRSEAGLWNNYIQAWEPAGSYFTGEEFYGPLPLHDLTGITPAKWPERRAEIFAEVQKIWGTIPPEAARVKIDWTEGETTTGTSAGHGYTQRTVTGTIDTSDFPELRNAPVITGTLRLPSSEKGKRVPLLIHIGRFTMDSVLWESFASQGIGVMWYDNTRLQPDNGAGLTSYIIGYLNRGGWRSPDDWGSLVAWSWGIGRLIDFFEGNGEVDAAKIGITGHSRYGKTALVAMAYDERIAFGGPTSSGSLGVVQARRHWGQDLEHSLGANEYHWMAGNFMLYGGVDPSSKDGYMPRKVLRMPVDAESLVALCAPRPIFVGAGGMKADGGDAWVDPYGEYLVCVAASPVYEMLGVKGVVMNDYMTYGDRRIPMPVYDRDYTEGDIAYRIHSGWHTAREHFPAFAAFAARYLK